MTTINIKENAGAFAENKDVARDLRIEKILPELEKNSTVIIDFNDVTGATQSFIHALISDVLRKYGAVVLDGNIQFKNCNDSIKETIRTVTAYMQET